MEEGISPLTTRLKGRKIYEACSATSTHSGQFTQIPHIQSQLLLGCPDEVQGTPALMTPSRPTFQSTGCGKGKPPHSKKARTALPHSHP